MGPGCIGGRFAGWVLNILPGLGAEIGPHLVRHPDVDKISFTGGNATGASVMKDAADDAKNISLELGGKSPIIVFENAEIDQAVDAICAGIFYNCGQMCSATSRLLVHQDIERQIIGGLLSRIADMRVGDGLDAASEMGPMTVKNQYEKVLNYFDQGKKEGLEPLTGGTAMERTGFFLSPTVYNNVPGDSRLWREEIFGPVLCVRSFADEEEAIAAANDSRFGLAATICSSDETRLRRVSARLKAGHIWWNMPQIVPVETGWGGFRASGIGRELGPHGLDAFLEVKHVDF